MFDNYFTHLKTLLSYSMDNTKPCLTTIKKEILREFHTETFKYLNSTSVVINTMLLILFAFI
jgi:hypothetical protein